MEIGKAKTETRNAFGIVWIYHVDVSLYIWAMAIYM